jgi:SAM-dependent methyltransferase
MERQIYDRMADHDERHWWYTARRRILETLIRRHVRPPPAARILEVGCGTGHSLPMLRRFGDVEAVEIDPSSRAMAEKRLGKPVHDSSLPELPGLPTGSFDLICALDVIEHIADDRATLAALAARLKPGGKLLVTVPAHPWMWSAHDVANHHHRRYSQASLRALMAGSPLKLERIGFFNSLLFPLAVASRFAGKLRGKDGSDDALPPGPINTLFAAVFAAERHLLGRVPLPPGLSLFAIASAAPADDSGAKAT